MKSRVERLMGVVAAQRSADQARLSACLAQQRQLRAAAAAHFDAVRGVEPGRNAADMIIATAWQEHQRAAGQAAMSKAAELDSQLSVLRAKLARSLGREQAVISLAATERIMARRLADRRLEDTIRVGRLNIAQPR